MVSRTGANWNGTLPRMKLLAFSKGIFAAKTPIAFSMCVCSNVTAREPLNRFRHVPSRQLAPLLHNTTLCAASHSFAMEQIVMAEILIIRKEHSDSFVAIYIHCT
jgi:hypothetical protein